MELSEVTGDVNLDDLDSEVLPWLVIDLFLKDRDFFGVVEEHPRSHSVLCQISESNLFLPDQGKEESCRKPSQTLLRAWYVVLLCCRDISWEK